MQRQNGQKGRGEGFATPIVVTRVLNSKGGWADLILTKDQGHPPIHDDVNPLESFSESLEKLHISDICKCYKYLRYRNLDHKCSAIVRYKTQEVTI